MKCVSTVFEQRRAAVLESSWEFLRSTTNTKKKGMENDEIGASVSVRIWYTVYVF